MHTGKSGRSVADLAICAADTERVWLVRMTPGRCAQPDLARLGPLRAHPLECGPGETDQEITQARIPRSARHCPAREVGKEIGSSAEWSAVNRCKRAQRQATAQEDRVRSE